MDWLELDCGLRGAGLWIEWCWIMDWGELDYGLNASYIWKERSFDGNFSKTWILIFPFIRIYISLQFNISAFLFEEGKLFAKHLQFQQQKIGYRFFQFLFKFQFLVKEYAQSSQIYFSRPYFFATWLRKPSIFQT